MYTTPTTLRGAKGRISSLTSVQMAKDATGMRGYRPRNKNGLLRDKRDDTHIGTIEKKYNLDLGVRSDMHLGNFLKQKNISSLNDLVNG